MAAVGSPGLYSYYTCILIRTYCFNGRAVGTVLNTVTDMTISLYEDGVSHRGMPGHVRTLHAIKSWSRGFFKSTWQPGSYLISEIKHRAVYVKGKTLADENAFG
ncbi:hypothetical protein AMELA_G00160300 [Ameiurus melas]|uniref:Uncharacterized protein n=1 Tax=Ameiurus melas TaxID=219545 RepID=A0A7J6AH40_AMEME|nr:hypothetical protein AMELA_G00160300 [Ameiurus melas]